MSIAAEGVSTGAAPASVAPGIERGGRRAPDEIRQLVPVAIAGALWWLSIHQIDPGAMGDTGYVGILPVTYYAGVALLSVSFCLCIRRPARPAVLFVHLAALIVMVHGLASVVEPIPRLSATWRHVGIITYLLHHDVTPPLDAYFSWPGFFSLFASIEPITGAGTAIVIARWFPIVLDVAYLAPLYVIFRSFTNDRRIVWLSCWLVVLGNWVGQDYFSPQGLSFFLYLAVIALLLRSFRRQHVPGARERWIDRALSAVYAAEPRVAAPTDGPAQRTAIMVVVILASGAIVASHQLTPFMLLAGVGVLVIGGRITPRALLLLLGVLCAGWLMFMAVPYLKGHLQDLLTQVGDLGQNVDTSVASRVQGSAGHQLVAQVRIAMTGVLLLLALCGAVKRTMHGVADISCWYLAIAPFAMVLFQPYGGEIVLRAALFSLPFVAFLAAGVLMPVSETVSPRLGGLREPLSWPRTTTVVLMSLALALGLVLSKYGNERSERFAPSEVDAVSELYGVASPDDVLVALSPSVPWKFEHYDWTHAVLTQDATYDEMATQQPTSERVAGWVRGVIAAHQETHGFVLVTTSQLEYARLLGLAPDGWMEAFVRSMAASTAFELVYRNDDAAIYRIEASP